MWLALFGAGSREQLIDALWDGSNERRHGEHFKVAVRHLRDALAAHPPVTFNPLPFDGHTYRLASEFHLDLDAGRARLALTSGQPDNLRFALDAYAGPFLPKVDSEWVTSLRAQYLQDAVTAALALGAALETAAPREALRAYERAVELDAFAQEGYAGLGRVHEGLGESVAAKQAYRRYARLLEEEMGLETSQEPLHPSGEPFHS